MIRTARLKAFAKLNLSLRVLYRRTDHYHELRTVFQTVSLADELTVRFEKSRRTSIQIGGTPHIPDNLVERAAREILEVMQIHADVHFELKKHIPAGAGLGGGSSDAAAVLLALPVLAGKRVNEDELHAVAARLGSDVPFFLHGGTALGLGRGEELYPLPDRSARLVLLVSPNVHSSTAEAYRDLSGKLTLVPLQNKISSFQQEMWQAVRTGPAGSKDAVLPVNDFEEAVFARHTELGRIKDRLKRAGAVSALMTGSGSSVFGIFRDRADLLRAQKSLRN
ncbi:MAG: 4-(cytidine 5'-diphospho)-2-C-methyl-D-erythritol kinase, partial [Acidobacteriota bacterium]|nr:4-(cytidine 5'-diphospho)-2-C-methyl-D-erythritol kinase [Acidobacteriota bacterium]